jgi:uncharacterized protein YfaP (DUF2135 family)
MKRPIAAWVAVTALASFGALSGVAAEPPVTLDNPRGGWNYSGLVDGSGEARTAYPTPPIDRGAQRNRTMIQGHLGEAGKTRAPPTLVVNGNPMTLYAGEDGRFERHYAFGVGSNGIEVRPANGAGRKRVQFYEANASKRPAALRIICSWDAPEAEVDLHVLTPDGQHAFWAHAVLDGGGGLDVDSVDGPGPEMFSMIDPPRGAFHVYVNYWGNLGAGGYNFDASELKAPVITTRITLVYYENTPREKRESFVIPLRKIGDLNLVKSFMF